MNKLCLILCLIFMLVRCSHQDGEHNAHEAQHAQSEQHTYGDGDHSHGDDQHSHDGQEHSHGDDQHSHDGQEHSHGDDQHSHNEADHSHGDDQHSHDGQEHSHGGEQHAHNDADHSHGDTADAQGHGHDHGSTSTSQVTLWDERIELFIEYEPFIANRPTRLVTHVTHLDEWQPRVEGEIQIVLSATGRAPIGIQDPRPARDGIYIPTLTFPSAGQWTIEVRVPLDGAVRSIALPPVTVYASEHDAQHASSQEEEGEAISFLKEQQWRMPFSSQTVVERDFKASLQVNGEIGPSAGGEVMVHAPVNGRLNRSGSPPPQLGSKVTAGQVLGSLIPQPLQSIDPASLTQDLEKAELEHDFAQKELERLERLYQGEAISKNRLHKAELAVKTTAADLQQAKARLAQLTAMQKEPDGASSGQLDLTAPISGTIIEADFVPGAMVKEGDPLFQIVDLSKVWLTVQVPESQQGKITNATSAWFEAEGLDRTFSVEAGKNGQRVIFGGKIDPVKRTLPLIFEVPNPEGLFKIGMFAKVAVHTGQTSTGPSIPRSALLDESGMTVAYVQTGGESFERRVLELGIREGTDVQVIKGLVPGERVVTKGAYQVRLAGASTDVPAHGHAH